MFISQQHCDGFCGVVFTTFYSVKGVLNESASSAYLQNLYHASTTNIIAFKEMFSNISVEAKLVGQCSDPFQNKIIYKCNNQYKFAGSVVAKRAPTKTCLRGNNYC